MADAKTKSLHLVCTSSATTEQCRYTNGVGKSTILESLGLMNNTINTIQQKENAVFDLWNESLLNIWERGEKELMLKRNDNFSFIFQSNNLFSSMTGFQNIISGAIVNGSQKISSLKRKASLIVNEILSDLNLQNGEDFNISKISGGQRQRVAFARAIIAEKDILFADDPIFTFFSSSVLWCRRSNCF